MADELKELERQRSKVQARISAIQNAEDQRKSQALIGRCFKYDNSDGSGKRWWLYFKAVRADGRYVIGPKFEHVFGYADEYRLSANDQAFNHMQGYREITPGEYEVARTEFLNALTKGLHQ
jgi:hypothetical protein